MREPTWIGVGSLYCCRSVSSSGAGTLWGGAASSPNEVNGGGTSLPLMKMRCLFRSARTASSSILGKKPRVHSVSLRSACLSLSLSHTRTHTRARPWLKWCRSGGGGGARTWGAEVAFPPLPGLPRSAGWARLPRLSFCGDRRGALRKQQGFVRRGSAPVAPAHIRPHIHTHTRARD
jgi:hypothetical protein